MATDPQQAQGIGYAVADVTERATVLIREEIELAKAEISEKITRLVKGLVVGAAAGVFVLVALMFILNGFAWLFWFEVTPKSGYWGYFVVAAALIVLGGVGGWFAAKAVKFGANPSPTMAIDEARKIKDTVSQAGTPEIIG